MPPAEREALPVSDVVRRLKELVEGGFLPLWVRGEISDLTLHSSGHMYFTLRDSLAQLRCVMFRRARTELRFRPEGGVEVEARGRLTVYEKGGSVQLVVEAMLPAGVGERELALAALRARLAAEGLFDPSRKPPLPAFARTIGVVTSPTGAVLHDILRVLGRRSPGTRVVLRPVRVQGEGAAEEIAAAVESFARWGGAEVLIVGRGGGSAEDLDAFNQERVVRSVAASPVPVISAVGHETDVTLCDLAASVRAPTPSAAAELASFERSAVLARLVECREALRRSLVRRVSAQRERLAGFRRRGVWRSLPGRVRELAQRRDELEGRLDRAARARVVAARRSQALLEARLAALDPLGVLRRGYAVAVDPASGRAVRDAARLAAGQELRVRFHRGEAVCRVERTGTGDATAGLRGGSDDGEGA